MSSGTTQTAVHAGQMREPVLFCIERSTVSMAMDSRSADSDSDCGLFISQSKRKHENLNVSDAYDTDQAIECGLDLDEAFHMGSSDDDLSDDALVAASQVIESRFRRPQEDAVMHSLAKKR